MVSLSDMKTLGIAHYLFFAACIAVLAFGICVFSALVYEEGFERMTADFSDDELVMETSSIEVLPPHGHEVGKDALLDDGHHVGATSEVFIVPKDIWVTGIAYQVVGAPALALHHGTLFKMDSRDLECPDQSPQPLLSVAQDQEHTSSMTFENGYGIFIPAGTPLMLDAMFHNPGPPIGPGDIYEDVSLKVQLTLAPPDDAPHTEVTYHLLRLSNTPCVFESGHTFIVPPSVTDYTFTGTDAPHDASRMQIEGPSRIVYWGAHTHGWEGGQTVSVKRNGEVIEVFQTARSADDPYRFDTPHGSADLLLDANDTISIEAVYTNPTDSPLRGAMGHLGLYLAPF